MDVMHAATKPQDNATAFTISELLLLQGWAEFHGMHKTIDLAHCMDGAECDEIAIISEPDSLLHWMLWRKQDSVIVQPMLGAAHRFDTISDALASIRTAAAEPVTDLHPVAW